MFVDGKKFRTLRGPTIAADFKALVIDYIDQRYGAGAEGAGDGGGVVCQHGSTRAAREVSPSILAVFQYQPIPRDQRRAEFARGRKQDAVSRIAWRSARQE